MNELLAFLRALCDEREQAALAATWCEDAGTWRAEVSPYPWVGKSSGLRWYVIDSLDDGVIPDVDPQASDAEGVARHVALNDPASVLAEVDAKRRRMVLILALLANGEDRLAQELARLEALPPLLPAWLPGGVAAGMSGQPGAGCDAPRAVHPHWCGFCGAKLLFTAVECRLLSGVPSCPRCRETDWRGEVDELTAPNIRENL